MQIVRTEKEFEKRMNRYAKTDEFKKGITELKALAKALAAKQKKKADADKLKPVQEVLF